jgi:hypothetical protein
VIAVLGVTSEAVAQSGGDAALAETLFQDGKKLMEAEKYADACPKLAESHKLDPSGGTILVLAVCYEKGGRTASAWAAYQEALSFAKRDRRDEREQRAKERISALEPKLSRLTVKVPAPVAALPGLVVTRDGTPLAKAAWGASVPVDPGEHVVEAMADGREKATTRVTVGAQSDAKDIEVPMPAEKKGAAAPVASSDATPTREPPPASSRGTIGIVVLAASAVSLGVGTMFGLRALSKQSDANAACPDTKCSDAAAVSANDSARSAAKVADVAVVLGLVGAGVGTYLLLSKPSPESSARRVWLSPTAGPTGGGLAAGGAW